MSRTEAPEPRADDAPSSDELAPSPSRTLADWLVVLACLGCQIGMGVGGYVFPVFLKPVAEDLGWSRTTYVAAQPIMSTSVALVGPLVGWLAERLGPRPILVFGALLVSGSLFGASRIETPFELYGIGVGIGVAVACLGDLPTAVAIAGRFARDRGFALALVYIGSNLGGALVPLLAHRLAGGGSWRQAFEPLALGLLVFLLVCAALVARAPRPPGASALRSSDEPDGDGARQEVQRSRAALRASVQSLDFWLIFWALFAFYFYRLGVNAHLVAFLSDLGYSGGEAASGYSLTLAFGILGKLGAGRAADRIGIRPAVLGVFGLLLLASALLASGLPAGSVPVFLFLHGVATAAEDVVVPLLVAHRFGGKKMASLYGVLLLALVPGGSAGPLAAGWIFDQTGAYGPVFLLFLIFNISSLACLSLVGRWRGREGSPRDGLGRSGG